MSKYLIDGFLNEIEKIAKRREKTFWEKYKIPIIQGITLAAILANLHRLHQSARAQGRYWGSYGRSQWAPSISRLTPEKAMKTVGVRPGMSREQMVSIKRQAAFRFHPDRPGGSSEKMKEFNEAWQFLRQKGFTKGAQFSLPILLAHLRASKYVYRPQLDYLKKLIRALIKKSEMPKLPLEDLLELKLRGLL